MTQFNRERQGRTNVHGNKRSGQQRVGGSKQSNKQQSTQSASAAVDKAVLETLEDRRLMSAVTLDDGVLTFRAEGGSPFKVTVNQKADKITAFASGVGNRTFDRSAVESIRVIGGAGNDTVFIDDKVDVPATIQTGAGNDRIAGGAAADTIDAGAGDDNVAGFGGNDRVNAGDGDDKVYGGRGADHLEGGAGDDLVDGGSGNDTLRGGAGEDRIHGGAQADDISGGDGDDTLRGGLGNDTLRGGAGQDRLNGESGDDKLMPADDTPASSNGGGNNSGGGTVGGSNNSGGTNNGNSNNGGTNTGGNTGGNTNTGNNGTGGSDTDNGSGTDNNNGGGTVDNTNGPQPSIDFITTGGYAGHTVHVNALATKLKVGDPLSARYHWNFGDPGSRYNQLSGWNAAHVYDKPGTYTVTLTVTDEAGKTAAVTGKVVIKNDTRRVIYVDNKGSDSNTGATPETAVKSAKRATELLGDNTRILFRNGQSFDVVDAIELDGRDMTVGTYGTGSKARLRKVDGGSSSGIFSVKPQANNVMVDGIEMDSVWTMDSAYGNKKIPARGLTVYGTNVTVRGCTFRNISEAVNAYGKPRGLLVQDCNMTDELRGHGIWGEGSDHVYLGNTMVQSHQEHLIRTSGTGVTRLLIAHNKLSRPSNIKGSLELRTANWFYVADNDIKGGTLRAGLQMHDKEQVPNWAELTTKWGVIENNRTERVFMNFRPGIQHVSFRNNVMQLDEGKAIQLENLREGYDDVRKTDDVRIEGNTVLNDDKVGKFLQVHGHATNIVVKNNLYVAPNLEATGGGGSGAIVVMDSDLSGFKEVSNNVWPEVETNSRQGGLNYVWSSWGDSRGYQSAAKWESYNQVWGERYADVSLGNTHRVVMGSGDAWAGASLARAA